MRDKFVFLPNTDKTGSNLLPLPQDQLRIRDSLIAKAVELLGEHKQAATGKEDTAIATMTRTIGTAPDKHTVLWQYEQAHLAAGEDWEAAKFALRSYVDDQRNRRILVTDFLKSYAGNNRGTAQVEGILDPDKDEAKQTFAKLGTVFLGDARFTDLRPQPTGLTNTVYVLGRIASEGRKPVLRQDANHTDAHFVWLPNSETYVRRFVTRGLNHADISNIASNADLTAPVQTVNAQAREILTTDQPTRHAVTENTPLNEKQQILSHTRGWQKRYISTGVSSRPVYSTRGTQFMSLYGTAVIDLAKVDLKNVFDIHDHISVKNLMGWDAQQVVTSTGPGSGATTFTQEEFLALRDVLRTRELLIKFSVPIAAVNKVPDGNRILGIGSKDRNFVKNLPGTLARTYSAGWANVRDSEALPYKSINGRYWAFMLFDDEGARGTFVTGLPRLKGTQNLLLSRYKMPDTLPGWK